MVTHKGLATTFRNHLEQDFVDNNKIAQEEAPVPAMFDVLVPTGRREEAPSIQDFKVFPPKKITGKIKVQPLLTPDNYPEVIAELISQAKERVLIENQSFNFWKNAEFDAKALPEHRQGGPRSPAEGNSTSASFSAAALARSATPCGR